MAKYGEEQYGWPSGRPGGPAGCGVWKGIYNRLNSFVRFTSFRVHNGEGVKFWQDPWCASGPLCILFPMCYDLVVDKWGLVKDH